MNIKSMTGFGVAQEESDLSRLEVSIKSVNGRFLETRFHLPRELLDMEGVFKKKLQKVMARGTVDVFISRQIKADATVAQVRLSEVVTKQWLVAFKDLARLSKIKGSVSLDTLSRLPEVFQVETSKGSSPSERKVLEQVFEKAVKALNQERAREGKSIAEDLLSHLQSLRDKLLQMKELRDEANEQILEKTKNRIQIRLSELKLDENRLLQEVAILVDRADINEEIVRLQEHLTTFEKVLKKTEAIGKQLDFFTQEFLREINTIGSKTQLAKLTECVVQAKTIIERIKEQVQNIE